MFKFIIVNSVALVSYLNSNELALEEVHRWSGNHWPRTKRYCVNRCFPRPLKNQRSLFPSQGERKTSSTSDNSVRLVATVRFHFWFRQIAKHANKIQSTVSSISRNSSCTLKNIMCRGFSINRRRIFPHKLSLPRTSATASGDSRAA